MTEHDDETAAPGLPPPPPPLTQVPRMVGPRGDDRPFLAGRTFELAPWFVALYFVAGVVAAVAGVALLDFPIPSAVVLPIVMVVVPRRSMRLTFHPRGVHWNNRVIDWEHVQLQPSRSGHAMLVNTDPSAPRRDRLKVALRWFDLRWVEGPLGAALREFRPEILDEWDRREI